VDAGLVTKEVTIRHVCMRTLVFKYT